MLALAYVWAVRDGYVFMYVDSCLDAGGIVNGAGLCSGSRLVESPDLGARAPLIFWFLLLGFSALLTWAAYRLLVAFVR